MEHCLKVMEANPKKAHLELLMVNFFSSFSNNYFRFQNFFNSGCTFTAASYPAEEYGGPSSYPPDGPSACSPNCYQGWHNGGVAPAEKSVAYFL